MMSDTNPILIFYASEQPISTMQYSGQSHKATHCAFRNKYKRRKQNTGI